MRNYIGILVLAALFCYSTQGDIPSNFMKCKRSAPDFNECLKAAIQDALPKCENGIPELGIPKLQPLTIPEATLGEGATGAVHVVQHYNNIDVYNFTRIKLEKVEAVITDTDFKLTMKGILREFKWDSDYDFNGQILLLPITGKGKLYSIAQHINIQITFKGEIHEKNEEKYITISSVKIDFDPEDFKMELKNLFNGDERLGNAMNDVLNENWKELWVDTKPNYESLFEKILLQYTNQFFKKVPLNNIFPL